MQLYACINIITLYLKRGGEIMETIYDVLSAEHDQVADLLQQATRNGS
jgi:hypothetical protein